MKIYKDIKQQTPEWFALRKGKITMSNAKELLTGGKGVTRASYLQSVAAEAVSIDLDQHYTNRDMERGNELEPYALKALEALLVEKCETVGFVEHDDPRIGASPDALGDVFGVEIKCPAPKVHIKYLDKSNVEREHGQQIQGNIWVCQRQYWYFVSFCPQVPKFPMIVHMFERNESVIEKIKKSAIDGADEVAKMIANINGALVLNAESMAIAKDALEYWKAYLNELSAEVQFDD